MSSILHYLADQQSIPENYQESIEQLIRKEQIENSNIIHLFCLKEDSFKILQNKWALIFPSLNDLNAFIAEVESSEEKQAQLLIQDFCVFDNVMFVTLQNPQQLNLWAECVIEYITNRPLAVFIIKNSFEQLTYLAQKNSCVQFKIYWNHSLLVQTRGKQKLSSEEEQEDDEMDDNQQSISNEVPLEKRRKIETNGQEGNFNGMTSESERFVSMRQHKHVEDETLVVNSMKEFSIGLLNKLSNMTEYKLNENSILSKYNQLNELSIINRRLQVFVRQLFLSIIIPNFFGIKIPLLEADNNSIPKKMVNSNCFLYVFVNQYFNYINIYRLADPIGFVEYSPIISSAEIFFNKSQSAIIWLSNIYYLVYLVFAAAFIRPLQIRMDITISISALLVCLGSWVRYFGKGNYGLEILAYITFGFGQIVMMSAPIFIADRWFGVSERTVATSIMTLINYLGLNFGFMFSAVYIGEGTYTDEEIKKRLNTMNLIYAVIASIAALLCVLFIKNKPPSPPSMTSVAQKISMKESILMIFANWTNFLDLLTLSIFIGVSWTYISAISALLDSFSQPQIGTVGCCFSLSGTIGGMGASFFIDYQIGQGRIPNYDIWLKGLLTMSEITFLILAIFIHRNNLVLTIILSTIIGLGLTAYFPIGIQSYAEKMYPASELVLVTMILIASSVSQKNCQFIYKFFGLIGNYVVDLESIENYGMWILSGTLFPFTIYLFFIYKTKLNRFEQEQKLNEENRETD